MSLPSARSIAFNRRLRAAWLEEGLRLQAEGVGDAQWLERMEGLVSAENSGKDTITKSMRYLRHIWTDIAGEAPLRTEAIELYRTYPHRESAIILSWGMAIVAYPFLNDVAATLGRLLKVQPEVKLEQLLRKLTETHGEKETVRRSGRYSLSLIQDLGFVKRLKAPGCYGLYKPLRAAPPEIAAWLARAWFRATGQKETVDREAVVNAPSLAYFDAAAMVSDALQQGALAVERLSFSQDSLRLAKRD